jgi:hypothetical protein
MGVLFAVLLRKTIASDVDCDCERHGCATEEVSLKFPEATWTASRQLWREIQIKQRSLKCRQLQRRRSRRCPRCATRCCTHPTPWRGHSWCNCRLVRGKIENHTEKWFKLLRRDNGIATGFSTAEHMAMWAGVIQLRGGNVCGGEASV